jgi:phosphinothricin acetyltransferase
MIVRDATAADTAAMAEIYAHHVLHGVGTFEEVPPSAEEMAGRLRDIQANDRPWLVAEANGLVLGFAYAGPFRTRAAYRFTLETSIYVAAAARRTGVGRALLARLIEACEALGCHQLLALIGGSENAGSIGLHAAFGFEHAGLLRNVGFKAGRWVDVVVMQKTLGA